MAALFVLTSLQSRIQGGADFVELAATNAEIEKQNHSALIVIINISLKLIHIA